MMCLIIPMSSHRSVRLYPYRILTFAALLVATACSRAPQTPVSPAAGDEWHEFEGTWTAAGSRYAIGLGNDRQASIADFNGSLLLAGASRPSVGFRAEAIV